MQLKSSKACLNFARLTKLILVNDSLKQTTETILTLDMYIKGRGGGGRRWGGGATEDWVALHLWLLAFNREFDLKFPGTDEQEYKRNCRKPPVSE